MKKENTKKERTISLIKEGTVIDHIDSDAVFKIVRILDLENSKNQVTIGVNMRSKQIGNKGIIKIESRYLSKEDVDKISLFSPHATINHIKDYEVEKKHKVELPEEIDRVLKCNNPNCVTNLEGAPTKFVLHKKEPLTYICRYCERRMLKEDIELF